ncbi:MAG: YchJ family protein [Planctomycetes bacterium]|nr:YchJ family protein [Planctomycetota bacterium]MBZ0151004.1 YchJ family protein [Planctomycetota bacterium]MCC7396331.1 YchJ family protein [Planctomycetota bacterium]
MQCPCTSGKEFAVCCEPIITQQVKAQTAEQLMRSRYSAYALGHLDWIVDSQSPDGRQFVDKNATEQWSKRATWHRMEVLAVKDGGPDDTEGFVDFKAYYTIGGEDITHHEVASFRKEDGTWYFVDGVEVKPRPFKRLEKKVGPNEPCPCGSGKKHKKCCGKPGATVG